MIPVPRGVIPFSVLHFMYRFIHLFVDHIHHVYSDLLAYLPIFAISGNPTIIARLVDLFRYLKLCQNMSNIKPSMVIYWVPQF